MCDQVVIDGVVLVQRTSRPDVLAAVVGVECGDCFEFDPARVMWIECETPIAGPLADHVGLLRALLIGEMGIVTVKARV